MCGRFFIDDQMINEMEKIFAKMDQKKSSVNFANKVSTPKIGEVFPSDCSFLIRQEDNDRTAITTGIFGYQNPYRSGLLINAKSETVMEKPTFKYDFEKRRCVIPAAGYYTPQARCHPDIFPGIPAKLQGNWFPPDIVLLPLQLSS